MDDQKFISMIENLDISDTSMEEMVEISDSSEININIMVENQIKKATNDSEAEKSNNTNVKAKKRKKKKSKNQVKITVNLPSSEMARDFVEYLNENNSEKTFQKIAADGVIEEVDAANVDKQLKNAKNNTGTEKSKKRKKKKNKNQEKNAIHLPTSERLKDSTKESIEINNARSENMKKEMEKEHKNNTEILKHCEKSLKESAEDGMLEEIDVASVDVDKRLRKGMNNTGTEKSDIKNAEAKKQKKKKNKNPEKNATHSQTSEMTRDATKDLIGTNYVRLENTKKHTEKEYKDDTEILKPCEKSQQTSAADRILEGKGAASVNKRLSEAKNNTRNEKVISPNVEAKKVKSVGSKSKNLEENVPHSQTSEMVQDSTKDLNKSNSVAFKNLKTHMEKEYEDNTKPLKNHRKSPQKSIVNEMLVQIDATSMDKRLRKEKNNSGNDKLQGTNAEAKATKPFDIGDNNLEKRVSHLQISDIVKDFTEDLNKSNSATLGNMRKYTEEESEDNMETLRKNDKSFQECTIIGTVEEMAAADVEKCSKDSSDSFQNKKSNRKNIQAKRLKFGATERKILEKIADPLLTSDMKETIKALKKENPATLARIRTRIKEEYRPCAVKEAREKAYEESVIKEIIESKAAGMDGRFKANKRKILRMVHKMS